MTEPTAVPGGHARPAPAERLALLGALADELRRDADNIEQAPLLPASRLHRLGEHGFVDTWLLGPLPADAEQDLPAEPAERRVGAALAGACGPTFFVWSQQFTPLRRLREAAARQEVAAHWLARLRHGRALAAISFAWLRRPGPPAIVAAPSDDGVVVTGEADWVTGWGLADILLAAAVDSSSVVHWVLVPFRPEHAPPGLTASAQRLMAMGATGTVRVRLDHVLVPSDHELTREPLRDWLESDRAQGRRPSTGALGVASEAVRRLSERDGHDARSAAERLGGELRRWRWRAAELDDAELDDAELGSADLAAERDALRASGIDLALRASAALVSATGGSAMRLGNPAGRLAREALFYVVQAQGAAARSATLSTLSRPTHP